MGRKWGVIDRKGRLVIPLRFKSLTGFDDYGLSAMELPSGWGFTDRAGKIVIPFRYLKADPFDHFGMAKIQLNVDRVKPLVGWIDRSGKSVIEPRYAVESPVWAANFNNHQLLPVIESGNEGLIDRKGQIIVARAAGELVPMSDPIAPGSFWINTLPYRSVNSPNGKARPPFQPACHDSSGTLIWSGSTQTASETYAFFAAISVMLSGLLFIALKRVAF
jgi:WG containing repeat